jgi:hypothetical protein
MCISSSILSDFSTVWVSAVGKKGFIRLNITLTTVMRNNCTKNYYQSDGKKVDKWARVARFF